MNATIRNRVRDPQALETHARALFPQATLEHCARWARAVCYLRNRPGGSRWVLDNAPVSWGHGR